jgi:hypothetical protein
MGPAYLSLHERACLFRQTGAYPFLAKKEAHSPENERGHSYKNRGWIPKKLPHIVAESFLTKRVEALY